jgi:hypothetical protein
MYGSVNQEREDWVGARYVCCIGAAGAGNAALAATQVAALSVAAGPATDLLYALHLIYSFKDCTAD